MCTLQLRSKSTFSLRLLVSTFKYSFQFDKQIWNSSLSFSRQCQGTCQQNFTVKNIKDYWVNEIKSATNI